MRQGIIRLKKRKAVQSLPPAGDFYSLRFLQPAHKEVRCNVGRIYVTSPDKQLLAALGLSLTVGRNTQSHRHSNRIGEQLLALGKHFDRGLKCAMQQQLGSPGK